MREQTVESVANEAERLVFDGKITVAQYQSESGRLAWFRMEAGVQPPKGVEFREGKNNGRAGFTVLNPNEAIVVWDMKKRKFRGPALQAMIIENVQGKPVSYPYSKQAEERLDYHGIELKEALI